MGTTVTTSYLVDGIDCDHCARAVRWELAEIEGIRTIAVDRPSGTVTVTAARRAPDATALRDALAEACCVLRGPAATTRGTDPPEGAGPAVGVVAHGSRRPR